MMSRHTLLTLFAIAYAGVANAQAPTTTSLEPLASKKFTWPDIPYQVTGDQGGIRGPQWGYNECNATTQNQQSLCQTMFLNNLGDFCMWSSSETDDSIGESEQREVAWCTSPGHGTRVIPPGAITGAQWLYSQNYLQVVGFLDQTQVGLAANDSGGELDPHGADEQGNPLGGIVYTNGFGMNSAAFAQVASGGNFTANQSYVQVVEWIDFIGNGMFCLKMCNPNDPNAAQLCNHIYDEIGCSYNAVADYGEINGTFTVCDSDDMTPPGIYTGSNGQVTTWFQPQSGPVIPPYTPTQVASSNCQTYSSNQIFAAAATDSVFVSGSAAQTTGTSKPTGSAGSSGTSSRSGSASTPAATGNGALASFHTGAAPFVAAGLMTTLATMMMMLA